MITYISVRTGAANGVSCIMKLIHILNFSEPEKIYLMGLMYSKRKDKN